MFLRLKNSTQEINKRQILAKYDFWNYFRVCILHFADICVALEIKYQSMYCV